MKEHKPHPVVDTLTLTGALFLLSYTILVLAAGDHSDIHNFLGYTAILASATTALTALTSFKENPDVSNQYRKYTFGGFFALGLMFISFIGSDPHYIPDILQKGLNPDSTGLFITALSTDLKDYFTRGVDVIRHSFFGN